MDIKLFEIRDVATFIPAMAIRLHPRIPIEEYLLGRSGYGLRAFEQDQYVLLAKLAGGTGQLTCDPYDWVNNDTMLTAHKYIQKEWYNLVTGDVIDVEFISEISPIPKQSESITNPI